MICPKCGHEFKSPVAVAGGEAGGKARVAKGFASPRVQALALKTRKRNARSKRSPNMCIGEEITRKGKKQQTKKE